MVLVSLGTAGGEANESGMGYALRLWAEPGLGTRLLVGTPSLAQLSRPWRFSLLSWNLGPVPCGGESVPSHAPKSLIHAQWMGDPGSQLELLLII